MNTKFKLLVTSAAAMLLASGVSNATDPDTGTLDVKANVVNNCVIGDGLLEFDEYDPIVANATQALVAQADFDVQCTNESAVDIALDEGEALAGTSARKMSNNGHTLNYALYKDSGHSQNWGEIVGSDTRGIIGTGENDTQTVYGVITAGQTSATFGDYSDVVTITFAF